MYRMIEKKMIGLLLITAVINGMAYGQQDKTFIIFPEVRTLYTEFDNLVRIHSENRKIKLACTGCDTIYRLSDNNTIMSGLSGLINKNSYVYCNR